MGAEEFTTVVRGATAEEAFRSAVEDAQYEHGHGGHSGTIAEKRSFVVITVPKDEDPRTFAERLLAEDDKRVCDKWGPAGCVQLGEGKWLFFGWASS